MKPALLLALAAVAAPLPAGAQPTSPAARAAPVAIPFSPPLERPLRYRLTRTRYQDGVAGTPLALDMTVEFRRNGPGFVMTSSFTTPPTPSGPQDAMLVFLQVPLALRLDAEGAIVAIENEDAWWPQVQAAFARFAEAQGGRMAAAAPRIIAALQSLPAEARVDLVARNQLPLVEFAGSRLSPGETSNVQIPQQTPFGTVTQDWRVTFERAEPGTAHYSATVTLPPGQGMMFGGGGGGGGPRPLPPGGAGLPRGAPVPRSESTVRNDRYRVATATGLTTAFQSSTAVAAPAGGAPGAPLESWSLETTE